MNVAYFRWKYLENPYLTDPLVVVATFGGRVIAMRAMYGATWEVPGHDAPAPAPCAADLVIEPDHRDAGLYGELNDYAIEELNQRGHPYVLNLTANPENYVAATVTRGWRSVGSLRILTRRSATGDRAATVIPRIADSSRLYDLGRRAVRLGRRVRERLQVDPLAALDRLEDRTGAVHPIHVTKDVPTEQIAGLVRSLGPSDRIRHVRDEAYTAWRYRNPRAGYRFITWGGRDPVGYMVVQSLEGRRRTAIADWEARDPDVRRTLLDLVTRSKLANLRTWSATLSPATIDALTENGFKETFSTGVLRYAGRFLVKPLEAAGSESDPFLALDPTTMESWDLRMIYSDGA